MNPATILFLEPKGTLLEVIRKAKERGYHVVALNSDQSLLDQAPAPYRSAIPLIDEVHRIEDWSNQEQITQIAERLGESKAIAGIFSGVDPCAEITAKLRTLLRLPTPTPAAMARILNKYELRSELRAAKLSRLSNFHGQEVRTWTDWKLDRPYYFKPLHGFFSTYVRRCESLGELKAAIAAFDQGIDTEAPFIKSYLSRSRDFHLEEAIDGELLSVEGFSSGGSFRSLGLLSRILYSQDPTVEMGSCFPYPHPREDDLVRLVAEAHRLLGITDGPTHTEVIVSPSGQMEIIDLNPRFVGADVLQSINHAYGIKIEDSLLDFALGQYSPGNYQTKQYSCLQYILPPTGLTRFDSIRFPDSGEVPFSTSYLAPGTAIRQSNRQLDYLGCYLTTMPSFDEAISRSRRLRATVRVNDSFEGAY